jgi:hypothetical protein
VGLQPARAADLLGAVTANAYNLLAIGIFIARLMGRPHVGFWLGILALCSVAPLTYLLCLAASTGRPAIYFVWLGLMILFQIVELTLDYVLGLEFRTVRWATIAYVMLFFGATGGMIGVAAQAGWPWAWITSLTFLAMAALAFVQRAKTGI